MIIAQLLGTLTLIPFQPCQLRKCIGPLGGGRVKPGVSRGQAHRPRTDIVTRNKGERQQHFVFDQLPKVELCGNNQQVLFDVSFTSDGQSIDTAVKVIVDKGLSLRHLVEKKQTLEDAFLATVEGAEPGVDKKKRKPRAVGGSDR